MARSTPEELAAMHDIEWILRGVSFSIDPDQTAAIVGHTGAGKSTIISLMMRFYDIQHGQILIDGVDVREHDLLRLRQHFGVVLQDPVLFSGTIGSNIRMGTASITDEQMRAAAEQVNIHDFITSLPGGYDEALRERGNSLSTGQKQLINFARALAHNPRILILDEATSSVDTDTETPRSPGARTDDPRADLGSDRASPVHDPASRQHSRDAQRPTARDGQPPGAAGSTGHLLEALSTAI